MFYQHILHKRRGSVPCILFAPCRVEDSFIVFIGKRDNDCGWARIGGGYIVQGDANRQIRIADGCFPCKRMALMYEQTVPRRHYGNSGKARAVQGSRKDSHIDPALRKLFYDNRIRHFHQIQTEVRIFMIKRGDELTVDKVEDPVRSLCGNDYRVWISSDPVCKRNTENCRTGESTPTILRRGEMTLL